MKSISMIITYICCLTAATQTTILLASGYLISRNYFIGKMEKLGQSYLHVDSEQVISLLAEIYYHLNSAEIIDQRSLVLKNKYNQILDNSAKIILDTHPEIFADQLQVLKGVDNEFSYFLDEWRNNFVWNNENDGNLERRYENIEFFFKRQIGTFLAAPEKSPAALINTLVYGNGWCDVFDFRYLIERKIDDDGVKLSKLAYLLYELGERHAFIPYDADVLALQKFSTACDILVEREIDDERRKAFLSAILDSNLDTPIAELDAYIVDNSRDGICAKLERDGFVSLRERFFDAKSLDMFAFDCIQDLVQRWSCEFNSPKIQMYQATLLSRWLERLGQFVERNNGMDLVIQHDTIDKYLKRLVDEVPASDAHLAYHHGTGLCNIIDNSKLSAIAKSFLFVERLGSEFSYDYVPDTADVKVLTNFKYLRIVCKFRRDRVLSKRSKRKRSDS